MPFEGKTAAGRYWPKNLQCQAVEKSLLVRCPANVHFSLLIVFARHHPAPFDFTFMVACFGLHDGYQLPRFPVDLLIENRPRIDILMLLQCGGLVEGTTTKLQCGTVGYLARDAAPIF